MRRSRLVGVVMGSIPLAACFPPVERTPPPADAPPEILALAGAAVLIGAGDIATCPSPYDEATAALVDSVARADSAAGVEDAIFTLGDNVYPSGAKRYFDACWRPSWGDTSRRIMRVIRPAVGNHDLDFNLGADYYDLFGDKAGEAGRGYYSYDLGAWHVVVLNSEMMVNPAFSVDSRRAQENWLREDLANNTEDCSIAMFHRPRFSSGAHAGDLRMTTLWSILYEGGVDVVLNGHEHHYERFDPQTPLGLPDSAKGITQFIVGTGGASLTGIRTPVQPNSARRIQGHHGVLKLTLGADEYQHAFLDTEGRVWDQGAGKCH
ncbi:MAG TPA: metallophosphoesterase [Gemmatimonadaceae bacterium]